MGVQVRLWVCWANTQQELQEAMEMQTWFSHACYWGNDPIPWINSCGCWPRTCPTINRIHKVWWRGTRPPSANRDCWAHAHGIDTSSMLEGDPPASIMGKLPHLLGKSKLGQRSWQIFDPEFQKALQVARAVHPTDRTGEQHVIITHMSKRERQQHCAKSIPPSWYSQVLWRSLQTLCKCGF